MSEFLKIDTVSEHDAFYHRENLHPLVSIMHFTVDESSQGEYSVVQCLGWITGPFLKLSIAKKIRGADPLQLSTSLFWDTTAYLVLSQTTRMNYRVSFIIYMRK